jgi:hypothetical protein
LGSFSSVSSPHSFVGSSRGDGGGWRNIAQKIEGQLFVQRRINGTPVSGLVGFPLVMETNLSVPAVTVAEFIAYADPAISFPRLQAKIFTIDGNTYFVTV